MDLNAKIYVAGHKGLVGSALVRILNQEGFRNIIGKTRTEMDLTNQGMVNSFFETETLAHDDSSNLCYRIRLVSRFQFSIK